MRFGMINTSTCVYGVIGYPIEHSLSPVLHNWFMSNYKLNAVYVAFNVHPSELKNAIKGGSALGVIGLNVTIPHKEALLGLVDEKDRDVKLVGAINTLELNAGKIQAHVTDPYGFTESLGQRKYWFKNAEVLLLGAGGAAKSVVYALEKLDVKKIWIYNRSAQRLRAFLDFCHNALTVSKVQAIDRKQLNDIAFDCKIIINTTSAGMYPHTGESLLRSDVFHDAHFVYDLVYNPEKTKLLLDAEHKGATIQNGIDMLIFQGLESLRIWTKQPLRLEAPKLKKIRHILQSRL
ncbi:shikimate dehydrogenase [candidate division KSB1 bacterium]|nr:shikimate dehydrogenase [candidate division KSB1 bacterium]